MNSSEATLPRPPAGFPLDAVLDYQRIDGAQLTIYLDNTAVATAGGSSEPISTTLASSQVVSLTTNILSSGSLRTGLTTFLDGESGDATATPRSVLLVRGPGGVYDAQWFNTADAEVLVELNNLLNQILAGDTAVTPGTPQATPEETVAATEAATTATPTVPPDNN